VIHNDNKYSLLFYLLPTVLKKIIEGKFGNVFPNWTGKNWFQYGNFCSELLIKSMRLAGYGQFFKLDENSIDPIETENIIANIPGVKLIERQD
jgi:hypothetical protein